ncbi:MAG: hypothetical protein AABZ30_09900 [Myxococcota bacterium]
MRASQSGLIPGEVYALDPAQDGTLRPVRLNGVPASVSPRRVLAEVAHVRIESVSVRGSMIEAEIVATSSVHGVRLGVEKDGDIVAMSRPRPIQRRSREPSKVLAEDGVRVPVHRAVLRVGSPVEGPVRVLALATGGDAAGLGIDEGYFGMDSMDVVITIPGDWVGAGDLYASFKLGDAGFTSVRRIDHETGASEDLGAYLLDSSCSPDPDCPSGAALTALELAYARLTALAFADGLLWGWAEVPGACSPAPGSCLPNKASLVAIDPATGSACSVCALTPPAVTSFSFATGYGFFGATSYDLGALWGVGSASDALDTSHYVHAIDTTTGLILTSVPIEGTGDVPGREFKHVFGLSFATEPSGAAIPLTVWQDTPVVSSEPVFLGFLDEVPKPVLSASINGGLTVGQAEDIVYRADVDDVILATSIKDEALGVTAAALWHVQLDTGAVAAIDPVLLLPPPWLDGEMPAPDALAYAPPPLAPDENIEFGPILGYIARNEIVDHLPGCISPAPPICPCCALENELEAVHALIKAGDIPSALRTIDEAIDPRLDGCGRSQAPDADDGIRDCAVQQAVRHDVARYRARIAATPTSPLFAP